MTSSSPIPPLPSAFPEWSLPHAEEGLLLRVWAHNARGASTPTHLRVLTTHAQQRQAEEGGLD